MVFVQSFLLKCQDEMNRWEILDYPKVPYSWLLSQKPPHSYPLVGSREVYYGWRWWTAIYSRIGPVLLSIYQSSLHRSIGPLNSGVFQGYK